MRELLGVIRRNSWLGFRMARKPVPRPEVAAHETFLAGVAKHLADKLLGPDGCLPSGTTFADLEELLVQLGRSITQQTLTRLLQRDATAPLPADAGCCPTCATPGVPDDPEPQGRRHPRRRHRVGRTASPLPPLPTGFFPLSRVAWAWTGRACRRGSWPR